MKNRLNINDEFAAFGEPRAASTAGGNRSFSQIMQEIVNHVSEIIRDEVRLAATEAQEKVTQVAKASVSVAIASVLAMFGLGFILLGLVHAIATQMAFWLSAVSVGSGLALLASIFYLVGRTRLQQAIREPSITNKSGKENLTWMKTRTK